MIEREAAVRIVEEQLERDYQRELSTGLNPMRMAVAHVEQHELVWIVSWTSEKYLRTRNPDFRLAGNGPYLIDRVDGGLHQVGVVSAATGGVGSRLSSAFGARPYVPQWTICTKRSGKSQPSVGASLPCTSSAGGYRRYPMLKSSTMWALCRTALCPLTS
ncbi:YrhB domain-containing protein [Streptomyces sp. NPDC057460]|uniref:YrhB domain-containing protein n=1 Tax=Streptomyces sp. NPDC057460 TaxID=3346141 RepID=UPI0036CEE1BC